MKEFERNGQALPDINASGTDAEALDWGEREFGTHRYHVRRLIEQTIQLTARPEKAAVLGAGNHGDVDLPGLALHFQQVTVMDSEDNMLQEWLEADGGPASSRLKSLTSIDYTGLDQISFYETFEEMLDGEAAAADIAGYLRDCAFQVRRQEVMPHLKKSFSLVISSGVHTQLFYGYALTRFYDVMERYDDTDRRRIMEALVYLRNSLVTDYNHLLLSLLKPDGRVAAWTEMVLLDEKKKWIVEELYQRKTKRERSSYLFEVFGKHGQEAALLGLKDLYDKLRPEQLQFHSWVWHTDTGKTFLAAGLSGQPRA